MFTRSPFHHRQLTFARVLALCAVLLITVLAAFNTGASRGHARGKRQTLTIEDRVAAQRAIEAVYHRQRIWPKDSPQPKPAPDVMLDDVLPAAALRAQVEEYLRMSRALEVFTGAALTPEQLQAELERMARPHAAAGSAGRVVGGAQARAAAAGRMPGAPGGGGAGASIADCGMWNADWGM